MTGTPSAPERFQRLRTAPGPVDPAQLDALWADLQAVAVSAIIGSWRGFAFSTGHPIERALHRSRWHGKRFLAPDDAQPMICRAEDGTLYSDTAVGRGEASLWNVEFRGEVTATMIYDGMAVLDHFKYVDDGTLMGVMNGKAAVLDRDGHPFYFGLERE